MSDGITADSANVFAAFDDSIIDMGVSMDFAGRDMMRVLLNNIIGLSWPKNKKEGVRAIDSDLGKIFAPLDSQKVLSFFNHQYGDGSATKSGKLKGKKRQAKAAKQLGGVKFNWDGNQQEMKDWHKQFRGSKGKVRHSPGIVAKVGPWKFSSEMYVTRSAFRKYRRHVLSHVAKMKAGWASAAIYFAEKTNGRLALPAFVRKQPDRRGTHYDGFAQGEGFATATNNIPYASRLTKFIVDRASMKTNTYTEKRTKAQAEKIVERFNKHK